MRFFSQGIALAGTYFVPEGATRDKPAVVICGGLGAIKEMIAPDIAARLVSAGYPVLSFDYRGFGESEGSRFRLIPSEQVADVRSAVSFLSSRRGGEGVVVYGNSFGAGVALEAAVREDGIVGVVTVVGVFDGAAWLRSLRTAWDWRDFTEAVARDRVARATEGSGRWVQPGEVMPADPGSQTWAARVQERFPQRAYQLPLESAAEILEWRPIDVARRLGARPLLIVGADRDVLVPPEQSERLHARARAPKRLVWLRGAAHHDATEAPRLTEVLDEVEAWLSAHFASQRGGSRAPGATA